MGQPCPNPGVPVSMLPNSRPPAIRTKNSYERVRESPLLLVIPGQVGRALHVRTARVPPPTPGPETAEVTEPTVEDICRWGPTARISRQKPEKSTTPAPLTLTAPGRQSS